MKYTIAFFVIASWIVLFGWISEQDKEIENLNNTVEMVVNLHNEKNHEAHYWKEQCEHYQSANEQLIKYAEPKTLNKAIKATQLPKMKEV